MGQQEAQHKAADEKLGSMVTEMPSEQFAHQETGEQGQPHAEAMKNIPCGHDD
ncbi:MULTISPECIES: hypothetical protein [Methylococcus]|jgi:hypothetical protein|uniref:hypothetical protein n=1 Tax=Methylococcus TaxID=413 RepID=UPI001650158A|nr:hypothetical protein [Methylococcus capsulatus]QXP89269.1 hypothetical protein KW114_09035 [Methylococcus capsulatus]QXP93818.1 hypothetical protein KW113_00875 [Methylococcus capsulatus]UQN11459.1 hypothetical protein M3M30_10495 [Methylococcus capsulatus]